MATAKKTETVTIKPLVEESATIRIKGRTSLITHCWSEKVKKEILDKQTGNTDNSTVREKKNPAEDMIRAAYWLTPMPTEFTFEAFEEAVKNGARFGFPCDGLKDAAVTAAYRKHWTKNKVEGKGSFYIQADGKAQDGKDCVEIHYGEVRLNEDTVKIFGGTSDIRHRPEFIDWYMDINVFYDSDSSIKIGDIVNFFNAAGFVCGIGEHRMEKSGQNGMFRVVPID